MLLTEALNAQTDIFSPHRLFSELLTFLHACILFHFVVVHIMEYMLNKTVQKTNKKFVFCYVVMFHQAVSALLQKMLAGYLEVSHGLCRALLSAKRLKW